MDKYHSSRLIVTLILTGLFIASCGGGQTEPSEPTKLLATIEVVVQPSPTHVPVTKSTEESPTQIPSPRADAPLSLSGPWWVFSTENGLWVVNPDGSGLRQLTGSLNLLSDLPDGAAPQGGHLAYITGTDTIHGLTLNLLSLPSGENRIVTPLTSAESEPSPEAVQVDASIEAVRAVTYDKSFDWSPDGKHLAFMGVMEGPTSDLYVYSLEDGEIVRHTDGPTQGIRPVYGPLGRYILHAGVGTLGSGAGMDMKGFWVGNADGSEFRSLFNPSGSGDEIVVGWVDPQTFLVFSWTAWGGMRDLRTVDVETGEAEIIWEGCFGESVGLEEPTGTVLLAVPETYANCIPGVLQGLYIVSAVGGPVFRVVEDEARYVRWSDEAGLFFALTEFGILAVDRNGNFIDLYIPEGSAWFPAVAPGSRQLAWTGNSGVWIGSLTSSLDEPANQIFTKPSWPAAWSPDGQYVLFISHEGSLYVAQEPDFTPLLVMEGVGSERVDSTWVWP
jgi:hypothetical protein